MCAPRWTDKIINNSTVRPDTSKVTIYSFLEPRLTANGTETHRVKTQRRFPSLEKPKISCMQKVPGGLQSIQELEMAEGMKRQINGGNKDLEERVILQTVEN